MIYQTSAPVEILDVKIDVSLECVQCGTVTNEKEVGRCNKCQSKSKTRLETCKMRVNVLHSPVYYEIDLSSEAIAQFVKDVVKFQGKARSEWMKINLERYWPTWKNKKVEMVLCLKDEKWSCIRVKELEKHIKPVPHPQIEDTNGRVPKRSENIDFEDREVKVEEVENPVECARQMKGNVNVQGEEQLEQRERRHENGGGIRVDEAVVRRNQRSRKGERERPVFPKVEDVQFEEDMEQRRIHEDFNDEGLRRYDEMDMDYDDFEAEVGVGRQRNSENGDLIGEDDMDMDIDLGRDNRDEEGEKLEESDSDEGEESSGDDSDSEQESEADDEGERKDDSDEEPEQKQTKRISVRAVTPKTVHRKIQSKKRNATKHRREFFSVEQKERLNKEFKRNAHHSKEQYKKIAKAIGLTVRQVTRWFDNQRYRKKFN